MFWFSNPNNALDTPPTSQIDSKIQLVNKQPSPRISKVIAARQAVIFQEFDVDEMLEQIVHSVASDLI